MTLVSWARGRFLLWDADQPRRFGTVTSYEISGTVGYAVREAESTKVTKYAPHSMMHKFVPRAIEAIGAWGACELVFINEVGRRIAAVTGDTRFTAFLKQRLALAV